MNFFDPYFIDWINLALRFVHIVTGIAWIGASFYFMWLDNHLEQPPQWKSDNGIKGDLWAIHGGGFYEVAKYRLAPATLPRTLHWFKWEAYSTWISGIALLSLMYYVGARTYLIDPRVADIGQGHAIAIGTGVIITGWIVYDTLCNTRLANNGALLGAVLLALLCALAYGLNQVFTPRGAYMHVGAVIGTMMVGNVFRVIIPSQKALVDAVEKGGTPDAAWAIKAKLRSTHNTYATLPLLFIMISNHYPITYSHQHSWLVLIVIVLITAAIRQYFVLRHTNVNKPVILVLAFITTVALAIVIAPARLTSTRNEGLFRQSPPGESVAEHGFSDYNRDQLGEEIIRVRCLSCHSSTPTDELFKTAPTDAKFDNLAEIKRWAPRIMARAVDSHDMPLINKTKMTVAERRFLRQWLGGSHDESDAEPR